jgi:hypothetical protein
MEKLLNWIAKKFCKQKHYSRAEIRKLWPRPVPESVSEDESEEEAVDEIDPELVKREAAARKLQPIIRGFIGRRRGQRLASQVLNDVDAYWMGHYARLLEEERQRLIVARERRNLAKQYVKDIISISALFVISLDDASMMIQRTWRGFWARKHRPRPRPPPKMRPKPRVVKGRLLPETLRRVWARSLFEPSGRSYLHKTDVGYKAYNMWEHAQRPPAGQPHGLRTRKIVLPAKDTAENVRVGKSVFAATDDRHAWLGVPVGLENFDVKEKAQYLRSFRNMEQFLFAFPAAETGLADRPDEVLAAIRNPYAEKLFKRPTKARPPPGDRSPTAAAGSPVAGFSDHPDDAARSEGDDEDSDAVDDDVADELFRPDVRVSKRRAKWLRSLAERQTAELRKRLDRITVVAKGDKERGSKHWDELTGRYLQYIGDGRFRHVRTGKETVPPLEEQLTAERGANGAVISHNKRQNAEEALPLNVIDPSALSVEVTARRAAPQVALLPATLVPTAAGTGDPRATSLSGPLDAAGDDGLAAEASELGLDESQTQTQASLVTSSQVGGASAAASVSASVPLLGRSDVRAVVQKSGMLLVQDTADAEARRSMAQQQRAERHRELFNRTFAPVATLSFSAHTQPPLTVVPPKTTEAAASTTDAARTPQSMSQWRELKQGVASQLSRAADESGSALFRGATASLAAGATRQTLRRRTPHYRSVYTWLPQPLLAPALQNHHYRDLSAVESYNAQQQRIFARRSQRLRREADASLAGSDGDHDDAQSLSRDTLSASPTQSHAMSMSVSRLGDFVDTDSVLSLVSRRPPLRVQTGSTGALDTRSKFLTLVHEEDAFSGADDALSQSDAVSASQRFQRGTEDLRRRLDPSTRDSLSSFDRDTTSNTNSHSHSQLPRETSQRKKRRQLHADVERDYFASDDSDAVAAFPSQDLTRSRDLDTTAALRPLPAFLGAGPIPQSLPETLVRRRQTVTAGLSVSSSLTVADSRRGSSPDAVVHRKFQHRPVVRIPGSHDYETPSTAVPKATGSRRGRSHSLSASLTRDAKVAPLLSSSPAAPTEMRLGSALEQNSLQLETKQRTAAASSARPRPHAPPPADLHPYAWA